MAGRFLRYLVAHPYDYAFLQQFNISPYGAALRRQRFVHSSCSGVCMDLFSDILEQAVYEGEIKDLPTLLLVALATSPILSVAHDAIAGAVQLDPALTDEVLDACWDAISR